MFWLPVVTICREVFVEGYIAENVTAVYKYKMLISVVKATRCTIFQIYFIFAVAVVYVQT
jgi:hypothetical protein